MTEILNEMRDEGEPTKKKRPAPTPAKAQAEEEAAPAQASAKLFHIWPSQN